MEPEKIIKEPDLVEIIEKVDIREKCDFDEFCLDEKCMKLHPSQPGGRNPIALSEERLSQYGLVVDMVKKKPK